MIRHISACGWSDEQCHFRRPTKRLCSFAHAQQAPSRTGSVCARARALLGVCSCVCARVSSSGCFGGVTPQVCACRRPPARARGGCAMPHECLTAGSRTALLARSLARCRVHRLCDRQVGQLPPPDGGGVGHAHVLRRVPRPVSTNQSRDAHAAEVARLTWRASRLLHCSLCVAALGRSCYTVERASLLHAA